MKLPEDIKFIHRVPWNHHASRGGLTYGLTYYHLDGYINYYLSFINDRLSYVLVDSQPPEWFMWRNEQDTTGLRARLSGRCRDVAFVRQCYQKIRKSMDTYIAFAGTLKKYDAWQADVRGLVGMYKKYCTTFPHGTIAASTLIELATAMGVGIEKKLLALRDDRDAIKNDLMVLGAPVHDTFPLTEELEFLRLLSSLGRINGTTLTNRQKYLAEKHFLTYHWLTVYFGGQPWSWDAFVQRILEAKKKNLSTRRRELLSGHRRVRRQTAVLVRRYHLNRAEISLFKELMFWRIQIENYYSMVNFHAIPLQQALAQKLDISVQQLSFLLPGEVRRLWRGGDRKKLLKLVVERRQRFVMVIGKKRVHVYTGIDGRRFMAALPKERLPQEKISEIRGVCGQPGLIRGRVRVVIRLRDLDTLKTGEILVTMNTTPMFVPAMKKSSAIVTDEGGITCHAAIVARELGIPCVIGTKIATRALKTGDRVLVNAGQGLVKKIK